jgi:hypothetical protein
MACSPVPDKPYYQLSLRETGEIDFAGVGMPVKFLPRFFQNILEGRFSSLLIALIVYLTVGPILYEILELRFLLDIFFSAILLAGIYAVSQKRSHTAIAFTLAVPALLAVWLREITGSIVFEIAGSVLIILFLGYTLVRIISFLLDSRRVTRHVIYAALTGYLIMGLIWASIYSLIDATDPGSFDVVQGWIGSPRLVYLYFSFVTLTTLGYGDITPLTAPAYSFSILEATIGQIYLTVLVARLVGIHITHSDGSRQSDSGK